MNGSFVAASRAAEGDCADILEFLRNEVESRVGMAEKEHAP